MQKNVSGQKITLLVIDTATNLPKTGDAANLTAYVDKDDAGVTALTDTSAAEKDATNAPGLYDFDVTQAETNADKLVFSGKSSTSGVRVVPVTIYTIPAGFHRARRVPYGTVAGSASTTSIPTSALTPAGAATDQFKGRVLIFDDNTATAALRGQATNITASTNAATPTFTVSALSTAPASGDTFVIV